MTRKLKTVFMGSPEFSIPSLKRLAEDKLCDLVACVTQPDKPKDRGLKVKPTPVKLAATELEIPVVEPRRLSTPEFLSWLRGIKPDLCIGVAFGQLVPPEVLNIPPLGFVNVHPSLLPRLRGAAPIQRALMNGEEITGVTTMYMDEGFDTGDIILQMAVAIKPDDNYKSLHDRLAEAAADLVAETVKLIAKGKAPRISQDHSKATWAPHIKAEDETIHWKKSAKEIVNQIRALDPAPGASTVLNGKRVKIWRARALEHKTPA
ncbi:MAG TPA: methionyl-tRNA formyltransferase, partial [Clostridia bacterium]|nr:methionyl-tRNA formyltransferase [Clostridia bacterium]